MYYTNAIANHETEDHHEDGNHENETHADERKMEKRKDLYLQHAISFGFNF